MDELLVPKGLTDIQPIREIIYQQLKQLILTGMIKPGEKMIERDIAAKFNTSRTPVREALRKLESEGFVEYLARKGVVVRGFNIGEIQEIFKIRKVLECLAVQSAIENISQEQISKLEKIMEQLDSTDAEGDSALSLELLYEFDDVIAEAANMPILKGFLKNLKETLQRYRRLNLAKVSRRTRAIKEHKNILSALIQRNLEEAEKAVCTHIENSQDELLKLVE